ncbi:tetratricopeptide repeat-containing sulfotransferase family protein [Propylenella binzhouense]|uniref:Sulfotransferase family protein n=1 Tax=Propylenella binzhouense TaxID=2555902 RepID=A0A964T7B0_9HYPH|nr:sulfotransferase [Propylenella binzhouense]MYZ49813.1 sulfotransferase family protein [Propylenella binzhouense]
MSAEAAARTASGLIRAGRPAEALEILRGIPRSAAKAPEIRHLAGLAQLALGRVAEAEAELRKAAQKAPRSPAILRSLGDCLLQADDPKGAEACYRKALSAAPGDADTAARLAGVLLYQGRREEAHERYRALIAAGAATPPVLAGFAGSTEFEAEPPELGSILKLAAQPGLGAAERRMLHFAAAKIARDLGRPDAEFEHYAAGKAAQARGFDVSAFARWADALKQATPPAFFAARSDFGVPSGRPIFIFGMPRSGTTLIEQILGAHPDVHPAGELPFFARAVAAAGLPDGHAGAGGEGLVGRGLAALGREQSVRLGEAYLAGIRSAAPRITDKLPHNFLHLWLIALVFPRATFIHAVRDPVATCFSCFTTDLGDWHAYTRDLPTLGAYYRVYRDLMAHWTRVLPVPIVEMRYEALVATPEPEIRRMLDAAGLGWDERLLRFHESARLARTASYAQVREPLHGRRLEAWRPFAGKLGPLFEALGDLAPEAAAPG